MAPFRGPNTANLIRASHTPFPSMRRFRSPAVLALFRRPFCRRPDELAKSAGRIGHSGLARIALKERLAWGETAIFVPVDYVKITRHRHVPREHHLRQFNRSKPQIAEGHLIAALPILELERANRRYLESPDLFVADVLGHFLGFARIILNRHCSTFSRCGLLQRLPHELIQFVLGHRIIELLELVLRHIRNPLRGDIPARRAPSVTERL